MILEARPLSISETGLRELNDSTRIPASVVPISGNMVAVVGDTSTRTTRAQAVQQAINRAVDEGRGFVLVPYAFFNYDAGEVDFDSNIKILREGGNPIFFDVLAYGAAGDGETDDGDAFEAVLEAGRGGIVYFPEGVYATSKTLQPESDTIIRGAGPNNTEVKSIFEDIATESFNLMDPLDGEDGKRIIILDMFLNGNSATTEVLEFDNNEDCIVERVRVRTGPRNGVAAEFIQDGIDVDNSKNIIIRNCFGFECDKAAFHLSTGAENCVIDSCVARDSNLRQTASRGAINVVNGAKNCVVTNNVAFDNFINYAIGADSHAFVANNVDVESDSPSIWHGAEEKAVGVFNAERVSGGMTGGMQVGYPVVNIFTEEGMQTWRWNNTTGWAGAGAGAAIQDVDDDSLFGPRSLEVTIDDTALESTRLHSSAVSGFSVGDFVAFSVWLKHISGESGYLIRVRETESGSPSGKPESTLEIDIDEGVSTFDGWRKYTVTHEVEHASTDGMRFDIRAGTHGQGEGKFYVDGLMLAKNPIRNEVPNFVPDIREFADWIVGGFVRSVGLQVYGPEVQFDDLPITNPNIAGRLWRDGNDLKISTG